jgi:hypothetical protein
LAEKDIKPRSVRKPRHGWFDYEVTDVFGDELGLPGFGLYAVLCRLCFDNFRITMGLREIAAHARSNKDTVKRLLAKMVQLGLVVERKGRTERSPSTYYLVDVKDLAEDYIRSEASKRQDTKTVSVGDSRVVLSDVSFLGTPEQMQSPKTHSQSGDASMRQQTLLEAIAQDNLDFDGDSNCLPQRQMDGADANPAEVDERAAKTAVEKGNSASLGETHLSRFERKSETHLSLNRETPLTKPKNYTQDLTSPTPPHEEGCELALEDISGWNLLRMRLKQDLASTPVGVAARFGVVKPGESDYDACFRDWWVLERRDETTRVVLVTGAGDADATEAGIRKYSARLDALARGALRDGRGRKFVFEVRRAGTVEIAASAET